MALHLKVFVCGFKFSKEPEAMSQFRRNPQLSGDNVFKQPDYQNPCQYDWVDLAQQWIYKKEACPDDTLPSAPPPPNISSLCYFNGKIKSLTIIYKLFNCLFHYIIEQGENEFEVKKDCEPIQSLISRETSRYDYFTNQHNWQQWNPVKIEPQEEPLLGTYSTLGYNVHDGNARNGFFASSCESLSKESYDWQQSNPVKIEPQEEQRLDTLGYNVRIENPRNGILASSCESLTKGSFYNLEIRMSATATLSEYWLPILDRVEDWPYIKNEFLSAVDGLCAAFNFKGPHHEKVFKVCASLMNSAVVKIMQNEENEAANNVLINGYFSIFRLLYQYAHDEEKLIDFSNKSLKKFIATSEARVKRAVPNLGEFLMHLTISREVTWNQISNVFMDEFDTRNVFWYCVGNHNSPPAHPELIDLQYNGDRTIPVFQATTVSRNLVMFQVQFANMTKSLDSTEFCSNFELVQDILTIKLNNLYSKVVVIKSWDQFYDFLQMPSVTMEKRNNDLAQAVMKSVAQGYHISYNGRKRAASAAGGGNKAKRWKKNSR